MIGAFLVIFMAALLALVVYHGLLIWPGWLLTRKDRQAVGGQLKFSKPEERKD